jgi:hypothetical protein
MTQYSAASAEKHAMERSSGAKAFWLNQRRTLASCLDAFRFREPTSASLENAIAVTSSG